MEVSTPLGRVSIVPRGEYDPAAVYARLDVVQHGGSGYTTLQDFNSLEQLVSSCCCETKQIALENRYLAAQNTSAINATTVAENQKVLDSICGLRMEMKDDRINQMQNQINQLQLNAALCGIPHTTPYGYGIVPQFAGSCPNNWNNNI